MKIPPMNIFLNNNAVQNRTSGPHPLPEHFEEAAQAEIDKHLALGVLTKCDEPTDWCAPGFLSPREMGNMSLTTLNSINMW